MDELPLILILGTADWSQPIATNQHYVTRELAKKYSVLFAESIGLRRPQFRRQDLTRIHHRLLRKKQSSSAGRVIPDNVGVISPRVIPVHTRGTRSANRYLLQKAVREWSEYSGPKVLWTYTPLTYGLELIANITIYHCVDLLREVPGISAELIDSNERVLALTADVAVASSSVVAHHLRQEKFAEVLEWSNVADTAAVSDARSDALSRVPGRVVFAGNLSPSKVDFAALEALARSPLDLHLAGPLSQGGSSSLREVEGLIAAGATYHGMLGPAALAELYWSACSGVIPYVLNSYTRGISPLKTFEYLAAGLSVTASDLPGVRPVDGHVSVAEGQDFVRAVTETAGLPSEAEVQERVKLAAEHSWSNRGIQVRALVELMLNASGASHASA